MPVIDMARREVADDLADVGPALEWAGDLVSGAGLSGEIRFGMEVCLEEALVNLILHGAARNGAKSIAVAVATDEIGAMIVVTDRCVPFDVAGAAGPTPAVPGEMREGGRGIGLMRAFSSELAYASQDGGNALTLRFRPPAALGPS
jgi:anti-sigma regulatory factor (Ser/Thr protein kinase)